MSSRLVEQWPDHALLSPAVFPCPYSAALARCRNRLDPSLNDQKYEAG
jgi:hypothetical protein